MKFLIDQNLSPRVARLLKSPTEQAEHVDQLGLRHAPDTEILAYAVTHQFVIVTQDDDFSALIATKRLRSPSIVQLRAVQAVAAVDIAAMIRSNLQQFVEPLGTGAIITVTQDTFRVRRLPAI